ncbi:MAG TPA: FAD-dependent thymidylate synthase [Clostridiaceae bacterium]|nr:FAD-dependent thymidylate synthase [Clostridiaceae bacterium]
MSLKVILVEHTPNPEVLIAKAAKLCYSAVGIDKMNEAMDSESTLKFINMLMSMGHESPVEHVSFTFAVEGVSRSLTHQLVRHRMASYSQQSQRYVKLDQFEYVIPTAIEKDIRAKEVYIEAMDNSQKAYSEIADILIDKYTAEGMKQGAAEKKAIEDARYVFPNACETKIVVTMNVRSLFNFFHHRCCNRAQWEIRELAFQMLKLVKQVSPAIFKYAGPSCLVGECPEGTMTCGQIVSVREKYSQL